MPRSLSAPISSLLHLSVPTGRDGPALAWQKHGRGRRLGRVIFEGARSRPARQWCSALRGEPGFELGPEARGVVIGQGLHGDALIHPSKENAQFVHASAAPLIHRRESCPTDPTTSSLRYGCCCKFLSNSSNFSLTAMISSRSSSLAARFSDCMSLILRSTCSCAVYSCTLIRSSQRPKEADAKMLTATTRAGSATKSPSSGDHFRAITYLTKPRISDKAAGSATVIVRMLGRDRFRGA